MSASSLKDGETDAEAESEGLRSPIEVQTRSRVTSSSSSVSDSASRAPKSLPPTNATTTGATATAAGGPPPPMDGGRRGDSVELVTSGPVGKRGGLPARVSLVSTASSATAPAPQWIEAVDGIPSFYPQSLWEEAKHGKVDHDRVTSKGTYRLPAHKRLVAGKYVEDPDLKDFSNPRYRPAERSASRGVTRLSRLGEFLGTNSPHQPLPHPSPQAAAHGRAGLPPPPVYATSRVPVSSTAISTASAGTGTTRSSTPGSCNTLGTSDYDDEDESSVDDELSSEGCEECREGEIAVDGGSNRLPPIVSRRAQTTDAASGGARTSGAGAHGNARHSQVRVVRQTYTVVEPIYPFSAASFYFPIYYGRPSSYEKADPRGLPQRINEELHPNDRANMPLSSVSVQKDNLNRMGLFKIGPGAVAFKVVISAFEASGMKYTTSNSKFNILWAKRATPYTLASLTPYQKVNHFPGTWGIGRKDSLAQNMNKMRRYFGEAVFDIVPTSFLLPRQEYELKADAERNPETPDRPLVYIMKPTASSCGRGIELCRGVPPMPRGGKQMVCQRYIGNPLLIYGRKFDLRLYCVVTSFDPLRVYLFDEGLVRFAAEKYTGPDQDLENVHKHLTNYSVNKTAELNRESSGKEYDSDDPLDIKWCISDFKRHLVLHHPLGLEAWTRIQRECDDVVIKALLSIENDVIERIRHECKDRSGRNCFELFGLDLMADADLKVRLIEANIMPSLATASNLDKAVKARMLAHMLTLVRAVPYRRNALPKADRGRPGCAAQQRASVQQQIQEHQQRFRSARSASRGAHSHRSASNGSRGSSRGSSRGAAKRPYAPHTNEDEEEQVTVTRNAGDSSNSVPNSAPPVRRGRHESGAGTEAVPGAAKVFVPHGPEADRPERTYNFGKHPMASARIIQHQLLSSFNDPHDPESMLSPYETLMLVESEEELRCAGGFRRIFPVSSTMHNYLPLFTHGVRRNNFILCSAVQMHDSRKPKKD